MDEVEAQRQIQQMVNFILNESRDKAQEIEAKSLEDFNIEKLKIVQQMKDKARQEYQRKAKQLETQRAIAQSTAINKARLKKIAARQKVVEEVTAAAGKQMTSVSANANSYKILLTDLLVQGLLALLEDEVYIRMREEDKIHSASVMELASEKYTKIIQATVGVKKTVKVHLDKQRVLPPGPKSASGGRTCLGGVIVTNLNRKIVVDNTLDARLDLVVTDCLPDIRKMLFPVK
eukprot:CAMPEP_0113849244 /NCGR_PEP_ID=MMETSP0372-20130328/2997_1 /TAXON_ID=340204 /ORGANISM="Lankesteria abbotti" /LENGTH=232 /DNA_ID=CAMNT_0000818961 /DNA_START=48 /DNA_END=746 /DNA_ORIENTATION=+ /assembly_acc=CAM_ASM_000359